MQSAQRKIEYRETAPVEKKRIVKMEGNVAYIYNKALEKESPPKKYKKDDPRYKQSLSQQQLAKKKAQQLKEVEINEARANRKRAASTILVMFIAFCAVALLISRLAFVCELGTRNNKLQSSINNVNNQIEELKAEMELKDSLKDIQDAAINKFGMTYPNESQKVHLDMD